MLTVPATVKKKKEKKMVLCAAFITFKLTPQCTVCMASQRRESGPRQKDPDPNHPPLLEIHKINDKKVTKEMLLYIVELLTKQRKHTDVRTGTQNQSCERTLPMR